MDKMGEESDQGPVVQKKRGGMGCAIWIALALALTALVPGPTLGERILLGIISFLLFRRALRMSDDATVAPGNAARGPTGASRIKSSDPTYIRSLLVGLLSARIASLNQAFSSLVDDAVLQHGVTLQRKRRQLVRVDDYGNTFADAWERERVYFVDNVIVPAWSRGELSPEQLMYALEAVEKIACMEPAGVADVATMDPYEYEHYCASLLKSAGWDAHVTAASGDQGVDIVATRDEVTLVIQAKRYANSVGNAAVQQVIAGKEHLRANLAAVVSPAPFTRSARELASSTGVLLLHHDKLSSL